MKLREFPILTDQNIHPDVIDFLRGESFDVVEIDQAGMIGEPDEAILALATVEGRIVFTHDGDFGSLAIAKGLPYIGIVYLRPGHVGATLTIDSIEKLLSVDPDMHPPFIVVVKRTNAGATIRLRQTAP